LFCNKWAKFVLDNDKSESVYVSGSNSEISKKIIAENKLEEMVQNTVILMSKNNVYLYSDAVIKTATLMRGVFQFLILGKIIPLELRNYMYRFIAKKRKAIIKNSCTLKQDYPNHKRILN
jgi:predicted DCC family thiol-disulfide oxidoreductase YuxK